MGKNIKIKANKLNLGCGEDIREGFLNMDIVKGRGVDLIHNLNKFPWPFKDNQFEVVYASHVLEHVDDLVETMAEIHRILKPNGKLIVRVPHFSCGVSYRDPTHKRLFSYFTFDYFTDDCFYGLPQFKIKDRRLNFTRLALTFLNPLINPLINLVPSIYERLFCWILPCAECLCTLKPIKESK